METDKRTDSGNLPNDVMLSSAEDLNNDGSFMGAGDNSLNADWEDEKLDQAVAELMASEEPEDAQIDPGYAVETAEVEELRQGAPAATQGSSQDDEVVESRLLQETLPRESHEADKAFGQRGSVRAEQCHTRHAGGGLDHHNRRPVGSEVCQQLNHERSTASEGQAVMMIPDAEPPKQSVCKKRHCGPMGERVEDSSPIVRGSVHDDDARRVGVNKAALIWMIILTIVLGGVIGIMIYAFIIDRNDIVKAPEPDPDSSLQENLNTVAGALEVYLTDVNLDNYNTDIVLVNGGGAISLKGTLRHSVYVNATSDVTLVLNGVTIESAKNAAIINLNSSAMTIRVDGMNTLLADGGSYAAALYSNGDLTIRGDGQVMIYSSGTGSRAIATKNGYLLDGGAVVALGQSGVERPLDDSTQAYFAKDLTQLYKKGTLVSASDEAGAQVVQFTAPGDFSSIFVSNNKLANGVQYSISLGSGGTTD